MSAALRKVFRFLDLLQLRMGEIKSLKQGLIDADELLHLGVQAGHLLLLLLVLDLVLVLVHVLLLLLELPGEEGEEGLADPVDRLHDRPHYLGLGGVLGSHL